MGDAARKERVRLGGLFVHVGIEGVAGEVGKGFDVFQRDFHFVNVLAGFISAWAGAAFLVLYSLRAFAAASHPGVLKAESGAEDGDTLSTVVATALALSLLNPHVYLDTVILLGGLASLYPQAERLAFALGAIAASGLWFYGLGYGAQKLAPLFASPKAWRLLDAFVGCVMAALATSLVIGQLR